MKYYDYKKIRLQDHDLDLEGEMLKEYDRLAGLHGKKSDQMQSFMEAHGRDKAFLLRLQLAGIVRTLINAPQNYACGKPE